MPNELLRRIRAMGKALLGLILILPAFGGARASVPLLPLEMFKPSLVVNTAGVPYVASWDGSTSPFPVSKSEGGAWIHLGSPGFSWRETFFSSLALDATGTPHVALEGRDGWGGATTSSVMKYEGGAWVSIGELDNLSPPSEELMLIPHSLAFNAAGGLFVAGIKYDKGIVTISVMKFEGGTWVSEKPLEYPMKDQRLLFWLPSVAFSADGVPYVAYLEAINEKSHILSVKKYEKGTWLPVGTLELQDVLHIAMVLDTTGVPYVAYTDATHGNRVSVVKFAGGSMVYVGSPGISPEQAWLPSLALDKDGALYVAYAGFSHTRLSVMKFEGGTWVPVGQPGFTEVMGLSTLALDSAGMLYVAYMKPEKDSIRLFSLSVMKFEGGAWVSTGSFEAADRAAGYDTVKHMANQGNKNAQYLLGMMYAKGQGVAKDDAEAEKWFRKAAIGGNEDARKRLEEMGIKVETQPDGKANKQ